MIRIRSSLLVAAIVLFSGLSPAGAAPSLMEDLGRGVVAVRSSSTEVFIGWRVLGTDFADTSFNLYRSAAGGAPVLLNGAPLSGATHFTDATADVAVANSYFVRPVVFGLEQSPSASFTLPANAPVQQHLRVQLQRPPDGTSPAGAHSYSPNDTSVGDVDGDGEYELIIKWEPSNARDSSNDGFTGNTLIDAYRLDGTRLWRIDLGINIRAGAHDTPFFVYDLDGDGLAEVFMRTAPGSRDGLGNFVADPAKFQGPFPSEPFDHNTDYRSYPTNGRALVGPEFLTVFNGLTGAEIASTKYLPARHPDTDFPTSQQLFDIWGDSFGNRQGRHYSTGVAYLDGQRPSIVMGRGYAGGQSGHPGRVALAAWNFRDGVITPLWQVATAGGSGGHTSMAADLNGDGLDDIVYGQVWVRHDGTLIERTDWGHGDALHVSQMDPDRPNQMVFMPHESPGSYGPNALSVDDGLTGGLIAGVQGSGDVGRGVAADIDPRFRGFEFWGPSATPGLYNVQNVAPNALLGPRGVQVAPTKPSSINHVVWWDGDPLRELLDNISVRKWDWNAGAEVPILAPAGILSNNGTKSNPCLQVDMFGDWREEVIWRESANDAIRIYTTTAPTTHRFYTLMHDRQYREAIVSQNVGYNQPPHPSFYFGDGMAQPPTPNIVTSLETLLGPPAPVFTGVITDTGVSDADQITNDTTLMFVGTAQPNTTVTITRFGSGVIGSTPVDGGGNWIFDYTGTALSEGDALFSATATDASGRTGAPTSPPFPVTIDLTPPGAPNITDVAEEGGALVFLGTAEPGSAVTVIADGSTVLGTTVAGPDGTWSFTYTGAPLGSGAHAFTATATDISGNTGAASPPSNVDTSITPPEITAIIEDTGGSAGDGVTSDPTLLLTGSGPVGATISVKLIGGSILGTTTVVGGAWTFDYSGTSLADGAYPFAAIATLGGTSSASSPAFIVVVDTVAPTVSSVNRENPSAAASTSASITFRVAFSEPVTGVSAADFEPVFSGGLSGAITTVAPAGAAAFDVTLDLVDEGTVRLDVIAGGIEDPAGNILGTGFTTGQTYTRSLTGNGAWIRPTGGGLWSTNANWQEGIIGSGIGNTADFTTLEIDDLVTVHLDSSRTVGNLIFGDTDIGSAGSWLIDNHGNPAHVLTLAVGAGSATIQVNPLGLDSTAAISAALGGTQGLNKLGSGALVLTGANTLTGSLGVNAGTLRLGPGGVHTATSVSIASGGGTLDIAGGTFTATGATTANGSGGSLLVNAGTGTFAAVNTNNSPNGLIRVNGGTFTATSINIPRSSDRTPSFSFGFVVTGGEANVTGPIGLGTNNSWGSMSVEGGELIVGGGLTVGNQASGGRGGQMRVTGGLFTSTDTTEGVVLSRRAGNVATANFTAGVSTVERFILGFDSTVNSGSATLTVDGGTLYVGSGGIAANGSGTFAPTVNLLAGTLGAKADWSATLNIMLPAGGNIAVKAADAAGEPFDISLGGVLAGAGGFSKVGSGRLTLGGANTFTGGVVVDAGILDVAGSIAPSESALVVNASGILSGDGSVGRAVVVNSGGTIMPGTATADTTLTVASLTWNADGALAYDLDATANTLAIDSALTKGGGSPHKVVFNAGTGIAAGNVYTLATFGSTDFVAEDFSFDTLAPGLTGAFSIDAGSLLFRIFGPPVILVQPEDATVLMGGSATFTVEVGESPSLSYQWFKDGEPIPGATSASLTVANVFASDIGSYHVVVTNAAGSTASNGADLRIAPVALVSHAPSLNSADVEGSIQQMLAESVALNGTTAISGDFLVRGTPSVVLNGSPAYGGTIEGPGVSTPSNFSVILNSNTSLGHVVRRTDPAPLPVVNAPAAPVGTRSVTLNHSGQSAGDWATVRNLTLNSNVGQVAVPAGAYGSFGANSGSGFTLGVVGATQPAVYHFQNLTLNSGAQVQVVGPVIVVVGTGFNINSALVGNADEPTWLTLNVFNGGLTLNSGADVFGFVSAPAGTVSINGNCVLDGGVAADRLTINSNGSLHLIPPSNQ